MSLRIKAVLTAVGIVVVVALWFFLLWQPRQARVEELRTQQEQLRSEQQQLRIQLERLQALQADAPRLQLEAARLRDALPADPRVPDLILQLQQQATLAGIEFLSISPSLPAQFSPPGDATAPPDLQAINLSVGVTGTYFELLDFIVRMERLPRAMRVNSFGLAGGAAEGGASPTMSVTFQMQMFMQAAPPGAATGPAPDIEQVP